MSLSKSINPSLVLVQPRKTRPFITERLLMGHKESNQSNKTSQLVPIFLSTLFTGLIPVYDKPTTNAVADIPIKSCVWKSYPFYQFEIFPHEKSLVGARIGARICISRSCTSEISRFFTYIEVLNLLRGSISVRKCSKMHVHCQISPNRKMVGIEN